MPQAGLHMRCMNRRTLLASLALSGAFPCGAFAQGAPPALSAQDRADIGRVEAYLNTITTLKARFQQIAPDGAISGGTAWIDRPGRMRFQYDPPAPFLLVGGHGLLVFNDSKLQQTSNIPIGRTPLGLLLSDHLKLSGDVTVTGITRYPGQLQVTLYRTATPGDGTLTLIFADNPLALRSWTVVDAQRRETRIALFDVQLGGHFEQSLFSFVDPRALDSGGGIKQ
jgi:outer membrane lipoprotein-sorting protein